MVIAIDIDGVLTKETAGHDYMSRTVNKEAAEIVRQLSKKNTIILFTARWNLDRKITESWLCIHDIPYDNIIFNKPSYDAFIDDKAFNTLTLFKNRYGETKKH